MHYRSNGDGRPLLFLHGGWGYEIYPFGRQINGLGNRFRILIPDRSGYGGSMRIDELPTDFHQRAAVEMRNFLDELKIERPVLWGHSDGAVIAIMMALNEPDRFPGLILEAFHYYRVKERSRAFFEEMAKDPDLLGERVATTLSRETWRRHSSILLNAGGSASILESKHRRLILWRRLEAKPAIFIHEGDHALSPTS
jgi:pimeloyl-ACP methyl ester carboxylesterase